MKKTDIIKTLKTADEAPEDPIKLFMEWYAEAEQEEPKDHNAMCLSTRDQDDRISSRIVLLKAVSARGFVFYTNTESRKGMALATHKNAALNFYWKSLGRQVRIEGKTIRIEDKEADAYYSTRARGSRIGAWASEQSRPLTARNVLEDKIKTYEQKFEGEDEIPRPPHWGGYMVEPDYIEFWHEGSFRLHSRITYKRSGSGWDREMLFP